MVIEFLLALAAIFGLFLVFSFIFTVCDKHLIPCVEVFIQGYNIPEEIAGKLLFAVVFFVCCID